MIPLRAKDSWADLEIPLESECEAAVLSDFVCLAFRGTASKMCTLIIIGMKYLCSLVKFCSTLWR